MNIGILTYAYVPNFGANLQALSTYHFILNQGDKPILIIWEPYSLKEKFDKIQNKLQANAHFSFIKENLYSTDICRTEQDIRNEILKHNIESIIIGSDAVLQDHPLISRIYFPTKHFITIDQISEERVFPNAFWGTFNNMNIPMALMSVSSQNSEYYWSHGSKRKKMFQALNKFVYISVRDEWTRKMVQYLSYNNINPIITPDPVFAFNQNVSKMIPTKDEVLSKFNLPNSYCLISFRTPNIPTKKWCNLLKLEAEKLGLHCVALPMPNGTLFKHNFNYEIPVPISPIEWYALIKYSQGYIGENMHPIIVALHNKVPIYSFDTYGITRFCRLYCNKESSKIYNILKYFQLEKSNYTNASRRLYRLPKPQKIFEALLSFNKNKVEEYNVKLQKQYQQMMIDILTRLKKI